MTRISCAIVEDDSISQTMIKSLAEKTGLVDVKGVFMSPKLAIPWLVDNEVNLLFLDVEMPGMTGLEMLRSLPYKPEVIMISGKANYAVEAFDLAITDYLLKPVKDYARFLAAVNKVMVKMKANLSLHTESGNLFVKVDQLLLKLDIDEILFVEAHGDYIKIHTLQKVHTVYATLKKIEGRLDPQKFIRIHRSFLVNISKITNIDPNNLEVNKKIIPISGTYKEDLLNRINVL